MISATGTWRRTPAAGGALRRPEMDFEAATTGTISGMRTLKKNALRMSAYGYTHQRPTYAPGSGAEYMARQGWDGGGGGYGASRADSAEGRISFYGKSSTKRYLIGAFAALSLCLLIALIVIILFVAGVIRSALPPDTGQPRGTLVTSSPGDGGSGGPQPPMASFARVGVVPRAPPTPSSSAHSFPNFVVAKEESPSASSSVFRSTPSPEVVPPPPPPLPPPLPIIDQNEQRVFAVVLFILQQANSAYSNHGSYAYQEAVRMINEALINLITSSSLQQYSTLTTLDSVKNSGDDVEIRFHVQLTLPSRSTIDAAMVRNVILADVVKFEARLNQVSVDQTRITVTRTTR